MPWYAQSHMCAYKEVNNVNFSENVTRALNG